MLRWNRNTNQNVEAPEVDAFLADIIAVCKRHRLWISHEDGHGAFMIETESTEDWLMNASIASNLAGIIKNMGRETDGGI